MFISYIPDLTPKKVAPLLADSRNCATHVILVQLPYNPDLCGTFSVLLLLLTDLNILKTLPKRLASCSPPSHPRGSPLLPK